jgi:SAM-dependent methyltransferase
MLMAINTVSDPVTEPASSAEALTRFQQATNRGGLTYAAIYAARVALERIVDRLDLRLIAIEQRRRIVEPWAISSRRYTVADQKKIYNDWDWSHGGEEWTVSPEWKQRIIDDLMLPHMPQGGQLVEIGPGAGRWSERLQRLAARLYLLDVAEASLAACRQRFADKSNVEYLLGNGTRIPLPNQSIDGIWSFDVFVHINPVNTRAYFHEIARVLKSGARAVIHHPGPPEPGVIRPGSRSDVTDRMIRDFAGEAGLTIRQFSDYRDVVSVLERT